MPGLDVVAIYLAGRRALIDRLCDHLARTLQVNVKLRPCRFDPESCYDASRGQYNSTRFLQQLLRQTGDRPGRVLGVTSVDLFIPVLTFVFGEAQVDGRAAVVSIHRLLNEAYGLPRDDDLLARRLEKEATHELGHTYGLIHCPDSDCVMHSSTYVEEIDLKPRLFCESCLREVRRADEVAGARNL